MGIHKKKYSYVNLYSTWCGIIIWERECHSVNNLNLKIDILSPCLQWNIINYKGIIHKSYWELWDIHPLFSIISVSRFPIRKHIKCSRPLYTLYYVWFDLVQVYWKINFDDKTTTSTTDADETMIRRLSLWLFVSDLE